MDSIQACQFLQSFIGKSSSSIDELFKVLAALVPAGDVLSSPNLASEKVVASTSSQTDDRVKGKIMTAFPVQISKDALASLFDISFLEIEVKVSIYLSYWAIGLYQAAKKASLMRLGERSTNLIFRDKIPESNLPPVTLRFSFRFVEKFNIVCSEVTITTTNEPARILNPASLIANHLPIKPPFVLDWSIRQRGPKSIGTTNPLGMILDQTPRLVNLAIAVLQRLIRLSRSFKRLALPYTGRILAHAEKRVIVLESFSESYSEAQKQRVKRFRSKLKAFNKDDGLMVIQAGIDNISEKLHQVTNLPAAAESVKKLELIPPQAHSLAQIVLPTEISRSQPETIEGPSSAGISEAPTQQTNLTFFNFRLSNTLQAVLLALVTEVYFIIVKLPICLDSVVNPVIDIALKHIKPKVARNATFCLSGPKIPENIQNLHSNLPLNLSVPMQLPPMNVPSLNSAGSMLKPSFPIDIRPELIKRGSKDDSNHPIGKPSAFMPSQIAVPKTMRSVSWGACSSDSESEVKEISQKNSATDQANRKVLPKSPKPKTQIAMSQKNAVKTSPIIEPIQFGSPSGKAHPLLKQINQVSPLGVMGFKNNKEEHEDNQSL